MSFFQSWQFYALASAFFAGLTAILAKIGVSTTNSNLATFIRTVVILFVRPAIVTLRNEWESMSKFTLRPAGILNHVGCSNRAFVAMLYSGLAVRACIEGGNGSCSGRRNGLLESVGNPIKIQCVSLLYRGTLLLGYLF